MFPIIQSLSSVPEMLANQHSQKNRLNLETNYKMAENYIHEEETCYSDVLKILETEYEKSKLRVFQDTLLCKRSIVEVELLCKEEVIRKSNRVNKKIRQHEFELQVYD